VRKALTAVILLLTLTTVVIQKPVAQVTVQDTRILLMHGTEYAPRYAAILPNVLRVPDDTTVTVPDNCFYDAIEVGQGATLRWPRTKSATCLTIHLQILPGGTLDQGTPADPIPSQFKAELVFRDVPIDKTLDPFQFGNGLLNLGTRTHHGYAVEKQFTTLAVDAEQGATQLQLTELPAGWKVGGELDLPDMRQMTQTRAVRTESKVTITGINGSTISLSKPLDFEHKAVRHPDGTLVAAARVAYLDRNVIIRSENPNGTRGHVLDHAMAQFDQRYTREIGLGRTTDAPRAFAKMNSDGSVTSVQNQGGRYGALHAHHITFQSGALYNFIGNVAEAAAPGIVWGVAVHGATTRGIQVIDNFVKGFVANYVTEDGPERGSVFRRNVGTGAFGNGQNPIMNVQQNRPGVEGNNFWFRGLWDMVIEENEAWNGTNGMNIVVFGPAAAPGYDPKVAIPAFFARNVTLAHAANGLEFWNNPKFAAVDHVSAHNGAFQYKGGQSSPVSVTLRDAVAVCDPAVLTSGGRAQVLAANTYVSDVDIDGLVATGCWMFMQHGPNTSFTMSNATLQNQTNVDHSTVTPETTLPSIYRSVTFKKLLSYPRRDFVFSPTIWAAGQTRPLEHTKRSNPSDGTRIHLIDYNGLGQDYRVYANYQKRSAAAVPAHPGGLMLCPATGLTNGLCWDQYGVARAAGVVSDAVAIPLEGIVNGVAEAGLVTPLGPPRYVVTYPTLEFAGMIQDFNGKPGTLARGLLTGDLSTVHKSIAYVSIDGAAPIKIVKSQGSVANEISFVNYVVSPGNHTLTTWCADLSGNLMSSTRLDLPGYKGR
jgi:hypothetical protein